MARWGTVAVVIFAVGCWASHEREGRARDAGVDAHAELDGGVDAATPPDADPPPDAGPSAPECRIELVVDGEIVGGIRESRAPDGRLLRVDYELAPPDLPVNRAWIEVLAWDEAGRLTEYHCVDDRYGPEVWYRESRSYLPDGRPLSQTITAPPERAGTWRWVYDGGQLIARVHELSGVEVSRTTVDVDLESRTAVARWPGHTDRIAWNEDGNVTLASLEIGTHCEETTAEYEDGFVVQERVGPCGAPDPPVAYEHSWTETDEELSWTVSPTAARPGGRAERRVWPAAEDDVELRFDARRPSAAEPAVFDEDSYYRLIGCDTPVEPLRVPWETQVMPLVLRAAPVVWWGEGAELSLQTPFYRP